MKDAITYYYYNPEKMEYVKNAQKYISYKYDVPLSRARDCLNSSIRPFNETTLDKTNILYYTFYNNGHNLSLKDFLERIVNHLIREKKKGRLF